MKIPKKKKVLGGGIRSGGWVGLGCQGGWERRIEAFVKIKKKTKKIEGGGGWVGVGGVRSGVGVGEVGVARFGVGG